MCVLMMKQKCLKSHHFQELFLKHRAWASLNVSTYITKILVFIYSVLKTKIYFNAEAGDGPAMKEWDHL